MRSESLPTAAGSGIYDGRRLPSARIVPGAARRSASSCLGFSRRPFASSAFCSRRASRSSASCRDSRQLHPTRVERRRRTIQRARPATADAIAIENFEIRYRRQNQADAGEQQRRPSGSAKRRRESASKMPITPPAENEPFHGRQIGRMESAVEMLRNSTPAPNILTAGGLNWRRANPFPCQHPQQHRNGEGAEAQHLQAEDRPCTSRRSRSDYGRRAAPVTEFQDGSWG